MGFALVLPVFVLASALLAPGLLSRHAQAEDRNGRSGAARYDADGVLTVRRDAADRPFLPPEFLLPEELLNLQLPEIIRRAVESHDELVAQEKEVEASREESREALADWFPELDPTYSYGWQGQKKPAAKDTSLPYHDLSVSITQLLWDFGATNAAVEKARLDLVKEEIQLVEKRQAIILSALEAYVDLIRANKELAFARQSEDNILAQAGLEEERLSIGGGLSTDVLQAKRDLAGATARRVSAEGELEEARNGFLRYFSTLPDSVDDLQPLAEPIRRMPADLGEALETAQAKNARIRVAAIDEARARQDLRETRSSEFFPTIEAVMERNFKENDAGTAGRKQETEIRVEISLPFNLGMTAINTLRADQAKLVGQTRTLMNARRRADEDVRNAWSKWATARKTWRLRESQAEIAAAFLDLARLENEAGNRTLQEVLSGETRLYNAQSDAAKAQASVVKEAFGLLEAMGELYYDVLEDVALDANRSGADARAVISPEVELMGTFGSSARDSARYQGAAPGADMLYPLPEPAETLPLAPQPEPKPEVGAPAPSAAPAEAVSEPQSMAPPAPAPPAPATPESTPETAKDPKPDAWVPADHQPKGKVAASKQPKAPPAPTSPGAVPSVPATESTPRPQQPAARVDEQQRLRTLIKAIPVP